MIISAVNKKGGSDPSSVYTEKWYFGFREASLKSAEILLGHFFRFYHPTSMVDFGAGMGLFLAVAKENGVLDLLGIEGDWIRGIHDASIKYVYHNLDQPISLNYKFDTAICLEVAEHLSLDRADTFIDDICNASSVIIFGAAMPFQGGDMHLNEQDPSYWIDKFSRRNYDCIDLFRARLWEEPLALPWHAQNTFLYVERDDPRRGLFVNQPLTNVYHPRYVLNSNVLKRYNIVFEDSIGARMAIKSLLSKAKQISKIIATYFSVVKG